MQLGISRKGDEFRLWSVHTAPA